MSVGTFSEIEDREYRSVGVGWNVAIRADSHLRAGVDVRCGTAVIAHQPKLDYSPPELCLA